MIKNVTYLSCNYPELSCIFLLLACSLSKGIFNALKKVLRLVSATECADSDKQDCVYWNALTVINKIMFTSPEEMVEFSGEKIKPWRSSKPFEHERSIMRPFLLRAR